MLKTKIIEGDRKTFVRELERAESEGWSPDMHSKNTIMVQSTERHGRYAHHSIVCQRWEV